MINIDQILNYVLPIVRTIIFGGLGLAIVGGLAYYLFIIKARRKWYISVKEMKADGRVHTIGKDVVVEKKINRGKQIIYQLKYRKIEVTPPPWECIDRFKDKEYCDYIRIQDECKPMRLESAQELIEGETKKKLIQNVKTILQKLRNTRATVQEIHERYI